ncbi:S41 family peptidase [Pedobacter alpinus]|uniref:S41 family peptidase n=1 Tax=Pedobacter alpinus TaxID=1590643 RepID=A0ABW5TS40_9SPHI
MRKILLTTLILLFFAGTKTFAQDEHFINDTLTTTLFKVFQTVKRNSVYRKQVDWIKLEDIIFKPEREHLNFEDFQRRVKLIFSSIGDNHASLFGNGKKISVVDTSIVLRKTLIDELKSNKPQLHIEILDGKYGYILIPSNSPKDNIQRMGQAIQDSLCRILEQPIEGVIVDLRANEGGSIYPLFTGLHQLIGEGFFGAFSNLDGTFKEPWKLKKGNFFQQNRIVASVTTRCNCSKKLKIAILLSQVTASAGEMLAISFKGRENTIFIGEKTYGLTTGNVNFKIDGYLLALSASFSQDRNGKIYNSYLKPDIELIEGDNFANISIDKKVLEAIEWFKIPNNR